MTFSLDALNSAAKYPSIPTYHALHPQTGGLLPETVPFPAGPVLLTEKVDGAGCRIIFFPDGDYYIGSREELLYASGDRIFNPVSGIVQTLRPAAERIAGDDSISSIDFLANGPVVLYLEVYGHKVSSGWKNYTTGTGYGFRLFDIAYIDPDILDETPERIAGWRENGGPAFLPEASLLQQARLRRLPLVPRIAELDGSTFPLDIPRMHRLIQFYGTTRVKLDDTGQGRSEGIVLRSETRAAIAKARLQSYERTARLAAEGARQ